ncbi:carbohydrate sulfotransferase 5-like isoform X1 [Microplitis mediator]|uniref:carbohydrate sulfotransferase 5-like isoform X1 n=1 Tax=Microplitis mediator TaxID=375433 RepID=UPI002552EC3F|nr:carbohydrate sulfotransferase 5-like isoform X1 [Microplitis mediator]XP_057319632.1 carbohydrate sulfotransferase 5-like isoform X1 [Microplitis mediator]XP_057319633.1 carbohydrate sulfotransferase 5-like isoform X1 [Microplitis mediator]
MRYIMPRRRVITGAMSKRLSFFILVGLTSLCILVLVFNQRYYNIIEHRLQPVISDVEIRSRNNIKQHQDPFTIFSERINLSFLEIQDVVDQQRRDIERDMETYEYPNGKYGLNISNLDDLLMEKGGRPMRSVILANWRSGSTFLGDVVNSHPANFYHYEPLLDFGIVQVRGPPLAQAAIANIYALFNCEYNKLQNYLDFGKTHPWVFNHNTHLWTQCVIHRKICWDPLFVTKFCRIFPFQSMKLVRLRLRIAQVLLEDESLGVRMVLLIRDPRGLMQSRKHRNWCPDSPDCSDPARVCADMVSDYEAAVRLKEKYPRNFKVVRYEDLSVDPFSNVKDLFEFYGLNFHPHVINFLETHTKNDFGGVSSTFRNSKAAPFHWRNDLDFEEVEEIQSVCSTAMRLWGYVLAINETHQKEFNPIARNYQPL